MSEISNEELDICMGKLMGWHVEYWLESDKEAGINYHYVNRDDSLTGFTCKSFTPSTDPTQAFECVEEARRKHGNPNFSIWAVQAGYSAYFGNHNNIINDKSPARAMCLSVKAFKEGLK